MQNLLASVCVACGRSLFRCQGDVGLLQRVGLHLAAVVQEDLVERQLQALERGLAAVRLQLTLPHGDAVPPHACQLVLHLLVALLVAVHLLEPEVGVRLRQRVVLASLMLVPEASVHEDAGVVAPQHDVGPSRQSSVVEPVAEPVAPEELAYHHLRLRVLAVDGRHVAVTLLGSHGGGHIT